MSRDPDIRIWDTTSWSLVKSIKHDQDDLETLKMMIDSNDKLYISSSEMIRVWNIGNEKWTNHIDVGTSILNISENNKYMICGSNESFEIIDSEKGDSIFDYSFEPGRNITRAIFMDENMVLIILDGASIYFLDIKKGKSIKSFGPAHKGAVNGIIQISEYSFITASGDSSLKSWDISTQKCIGTFEDIHPSEILLVCSNEIHFITVCASNIMKVWNTITQNLDFET
jgi:WD40 repeat protein